MNYPTVNTTPRSRTMVDVFRGYNHNLRIGDGEFFEMENLTGDQYPVMATREKRGVYASPEDGQGMISKDGLCWVDGSRFVINGSAVEMGLSGEGPKQLVSMGAYVIILPDRKYVNTLNPEERGNIEASVTTTGSVTVSLSTAEGGSLGTPLVSANPPEDPVNGMYWIDSSAVPHVLKQYSEASGLWASVASTYVKIYAAGIGAPFQRGDGVTVSGVSPELDGSHVLEAVENDSIVITGIVDTVMQLEGPVTVERRMPLMDFVTEAGNRLWGCRYGPAANGEIVNEIYCCKLGDFKNWNVFQGISTDSWAASVGTDGPWTGAVTHLGYPVFFKEHHLHKVYISSAGAHQIQDTACEGVQKGCGRSLAIVGSVLYYKSGSGIFAYDGSLPVEVSQALGGAAYANAVAGAVGNKYYGMLQSADGGWSLFVLDTARGLWHRESGFAAVQLCAHDGKLLALEADSGRILSLTGGGEAAEDSVRWFAETGELGLNSPDMKYVSRLIVRLRLAVGAQVTFYIRYELDDEWTEISTIHGTDLRSFSVPIRARRCDHLRLRMAGIGEARVYSITREITEGSDRS